MGISPIQYRPWKGERSAQNLRMYVILRSVFRHGLKSTGVKILLILGFFLIFAFQLIFVVLMPHERLEAEDMNSSLNGFGLAIFAMLLAAVVTSDLISEDLSSNSFVLYFSRAVKVRDYVVGKTGGALIIMSILCMVPPVLIAVVATLTQSGGDYLHSAGIIGRTAVAGALATVFYIPYGIMMSAFTRKKSYAAVGTFMSFFVLVIVAEVFSEFAREWRIISPVESLVYSFDWIYGESLPSYISEGALVSFLVLFILVPAALTYLRIMRQAVGK
ncbi:MAG: ABC transporter permease subunit [Methanobacteriota archaeon]|nr:MAG: ABC transporter permease subunit [Euryarchaeota archaeon]